MIKKHNDYPCSLLCFTVIILNGKNFVLFILQYVFNINKDDVILYKIYNKSSMSKQDWSVLMYSLLIAIIIFLLIVFVIFCPNDRSPINIISIVGTLITIIALVFSIYQQIQIKRTSELIEENSKNYQDSIRRDFYSWNITRAIALSEKLEDLLMKDENITTSIFVLSEIQGILTDCKKAFLSHYSNELENCLSGLCLKGEMISKGQILKCISDCKKQCEALWSEDFITFNSNLSADKINLRRKLDNTQNDFDKDKFLKTISELRTFLQSIKPDYLTLTKLK